MYENGSKSNLESDSDSVSVNEPYYTNATAWWTPASARFAGQITIGVKIVQNENVTLIQGKGGC